MLLVVREATNLPSHSGINSVSAASLLLAVDDDDDSSLLAPPAAFSTSPGASPPSLLGLQPMTMAVFGPRGVVRPLLLWPFRSVVHVRRRGARVTGGRGPHPRADLCCPWSPVVGGGAGGGRGRPGSDTYGDQWAGLSRTAVGGAGRRKGREKSAKGGWIRRGAGCL